MELFEAIEKRQSIRRFTSQKIAKEDLEKIVKAGVLAPTGRNTQNLEIVGVSNPEILNKLLSHIGGGKEYYGATAIVFVLEKTPDNLSELNAGACMENMLLAATSLGISSCWIHCTRKMFADENSKQLLKDVLGLDHEMTLLESIALGYKDGDVPVKVKDEHNGKVLA